MHSYGLSGHGRLVGDEDRGAAYARALRKAVKPGCVVVELGAGTAVFSMLACQLGAQRVYAIEADSIIELGREVAAANGFADRIVFIQEISTRVELPERCDVIVSDLHGLLPWFEMHIPSIVDARQRFLAGDGILIPQQETMWAAVVEAPELHGMIVSPWTQNRYGFDMRPARQLSTNSWCKARVKPEQLMTEAKCFATLDYMTVTDSQVSAEINWSVGRAGTGSGFVAWFDSTLLDDAQFSNSPFVPELIFGNVFFPWPEEVKLFAGDRVCVELTAHLVGGDYVWKWETRVFQPGDRNAATTHFLQSTFFSTPLSMETLRKRAASYVPVLDEEGLIERFILEGMDERTSIWELAGRLADKFPNRYPKRETALARVGECSQKYSR